MKLKKTTDIEKMTDEEILRLLKKMSVTHEPKEYATMVDQLEKLSQLKEKTTPRRVSPDTLALIAANLAGIIMVIGYERASIITTKAFGLVAKALK